MTFYPEKYLEGDKTAQVKLRKNAQERLDHSLTLLNAAYTKQQPYFSGMQPCLLDLYLAPLLRWCALYPLGQSDWFDITRYQALHTMAAALEIRPCAQAAITAEGLGPTPFTAPRHARPPEGSAT